MDFKARAIDAYANLLSARDEVELIGIPFLDTNFVDYNRSGGIREFVYNLQEPDYTAGLVNEFNGFLFRLRDLRAWECVLSKYVGDEVLELRREFTDLIFDYCLGAPYRFKSRVCFCACNLCDIVFSMNNVEGAKLPYLLKTEHLKRYSSYWPQVDILFDALEAVDGADFRNVTDQYRNFSQHRHPRGLEYGYTFWIERRNGGFSFGQKPPLRFKDLMEDLVNEGKRMASAFHAYRDLVAAHLSDR